MYAPPQRQKEKDSLIRAGGLVELLLIDGREAHVDAEVGEPLRRTLVPVELGLERVERPLLVVDGPLLLELGVEDGLEGGVDL